MNNILILGGDGYLGWPTAMYFSKLGWDVTIVDNYFRRQICSEVDAGLLFPIPDLIERVKLWYEKTGKTIKVVIGDLQDHDFMCTLFNGKAEYNWPTETIYSGVPDTVIHYAEQPSAPFSLLNYKYADITLTNNLRVTNNLIWAIREYSPQSHVIKLGTMGEYGTPDIDIEEGWLEIEHKGRKAKFLYPRQASSLYHTTKIMDTDLIWFSVRTWDLKFTDLMQGPVYGVLTEESTEDERLQTLFNYDEIFGTVINRFITQAVAGYPLTVYGKGGQKRGYLNIKDTLQCVGLAALNPANKGELKIYNQITETFSVNELAFKVKHVGNARGHDVKIQALENPRKEMEEHYYNPAYHGLQELGLQPHYLTDEVLHGMFAVVEKYKENIDSTKFFKGVKWG